MRIRDILGLLNQNKAYTIIVPNSIERKLIFDRFRFAGIKDIIYIDSTTMKLNDVYINVFTIDEVQELPAWTKVKNSHCIIEFPDAIPEPIFKKFHMNFNNLTFTNEIL